MKRCSVIILAALLVLTFLFSGCNNRLSSDGLEYYILDRCTPLALQWFADNQADATDVTVELFDISWGEVCFDTVTGDYTRNGHTYRYYLNVDSGEFCSTEYYTRLYGEMADRLTSIIQADDMDLTFLLDEYVIHGTVVSDQYLNHKRSEPQSYAVSKACYDAYEPFDPVTLSDLAEEKLNADSFEITVAVTNPGSLVDTPDRLAFLQEHDNWYLIIRDNNDPATEYRASFCDGRLSITEAFYDEHSVLQYRNYPYTGE